LIANQPPARIGRPLHVGDVLFEAGLALLLAGAIIVAGGPWAVGDVGLSLWGTVMLAWAWLRQATGVVPSWRRWEWGLLAGFAGLWLLQTIPLPPEAWRALGGRSQIARDLAVAGVAPGWRALPLDARHFARAMAALIPGIAMLVSLRGCSFGAHRRLLCWLPALACVSMLLGMAQIAGGPSSPLRLYAFHNIVGALGFFSYRNLQAAFLLMTLPIAVALLLGQRQFARNAQTPIQRLGHVAITMAIPLIMLGIALTYSRAGVALGMVVLAPCIALASRARPQRFWRKHPWMMTGMGAGLLLVVLFASTGLLQRRADNLLHDSRWTYDAQTLALAREFDPLGAGVGSFEQAFQPAASNLELIGAYVNHAHNDWLELRLELGWLFFPCALLLIVLLARAAPRAWREPDAGTEAGLYARAASVSLLIVLMHSCVDYPLRTGANLVVASLLAGVLARFAFPLDGTTPSRRRDKQDARSGNA
jgi:hypothetical protein